MYKDLTQISKANGIYRTLGLLSILSSKAAGHENSQYSTGKNSHKTDEQVNTSDAGVIKKSIGHQLNRRDSDVG
jgi:hypothetical protein